jgi:uncharacterized protein (TIGR02246 family)
MLLGFVNETAFSLTSQVRIPYLNDGTAEGRYARDPTWEVIMRPSAKVAIAGSAWTVILLSLTSVASAGPKEDIAAAAASWATALGTDDPDKVLPFYSEDAVLWGTLSPTVRASRAALNDYFIGAFKVLPGLKVSFGDQLIRVYGDAAVNTGYYTFSYVKDGAAKTLPARYSFTYVKKGDRWLIVDHHSSTMPTPPK